MPSEPRTVLNRQWRLELCLAGVGLQEPPGQTEKDSLCAFSGPHGDGGLLESQSCNVNCFGPRAFREFLAWFL